MSAYEASYQSIKVSRRVADGDVCYGVAVKVDGSSPDIIGAAVITGLLSNSQFLGQNIPDHADASEVWPSLTAVKPRPKAPPKRNPIRNLVASSGLEPLVEVLQPASY